MPNEVKKRKYPRLLIVFIISLFAVLVSSVIMKELYWGKRSVFHKHRLILNRLCSIRVALQDYQDDYDGTYPRSVYDLIPKYLFGKKSTLIPLDDYQVEYFAGDRSGNDLAERDAVLIVHVGSDYKKRIKGKEDRFIYILRKNGSVEFEGSFPK